MYRTSLKVIQTEGDTSLRGQIKAVRNVCKLTAGSKPLNQLMPSLCLSVEACSMLNSPWTASITLGHPY